jgi:hypothetical protein
VTTQTTSQPTATLAPWHRPGRVARVGRLAFGVIFTGGAAIHVAIVITGTETYRHGLLILAGGPRTRLGLLAAIAFHFGLMLFGWGFWFWSVPMLAMLVALLRCDLGNALGSRRKQRMPRKVP